MNMKAKRMMKLSGSILMILACLFIGVKLYEYKDQISWQKIYENRGIILAEITGYVLIRLLSPYGYGILVQLVTGKRIPFYEIQYVYCKSNLYKYVPGNVFQYVGRNRLAVDRNLKHSEVAMATVCEIAIIVCSSALVTLLLAKDMAFIWLEKYINIHDILICAGVVFFLMLMSAFFLPKRKIKLVRDKIAGFCSFRNVGGLLGAGIWFSGMLILEGILFSLLFRVVGISFLLRDFYNVTGLYAFSFCIGYLMPGAPGGVGIRETVLMFFLGSSVRYDALIMVTVLFRMISVSGDILTYIAAEIIMLLHNRPRPGGEGDI